MYKYVTEFIGTFFLVLTICLTVVSKSPLAGLAIGCSLMIMVYMGGHVSGGHYNPAVSLAVLLRGKLAGRDFVPYVVAQLLGALAASEIAYLVQIELTSDVNAFGILRDSFAPKPGTGITVWTALFVEFLFTFALALVVLNVATSSKSEGNSYYGLAIGFTIVVAALAGGGISGGAFNPAVGTGPTIINAIAKPEATTWGNLWIYWVGPLLGGVVAAGVFKFQEDGVQRSLTTTKASSPPEGLRS